MTKMKKRTLNERKLIDINEIKQETPKQGDIVRLDIELESMFMLRTKTEPTPYRTYMVYTTDLVLLDRKSENPRFSGILLGKNQESYIQIRPDPDECEDDDIPSNENMPTIEKQLEDYLKSNTGFKNHFNKTLASAGINDLFLVLANIKIKIKRVPEGKSALLIMNDEFIGVVFNEYMSKVSDVYDIRTGTHFNKVMPKSNKREALGIIGISMLKTSLFPIGNFHYMPGSTNNDGGLKLVRLSETLRESAHGQNAPYSKQQFNELMYSTCPKCATQLRFLPPLTGSELTNLDCKQITPRSMECPSCFFAIKNRNIVEADLYYVHSGVIWVSSKDLLEFLENIQNAHTRVSELLIKDQQDVTIDIIPIGTENTDIIELPDPDNVVF